MKILANLEKGMKSFGDYCVPMNSTFTLNVERIPALDDAVRVKVAEVDAPAANVEDVGDHVIVRYVFALDGLQLFTTIVRFSAMLPVFLM